MRRILISTVLLGLVLGLAACSSDSDSSSLANPVAPAVDTAPPVAPTTVWTAKSLDLVKVSWDANVSDPDLAGYRLTRTGGDMTVVLIDQPIDVLRFVDDHPFAGVATYAVTAVDADGNESPATTITLDYLDDDDTPQLSRY